MASPYLYSTPIAEQTLRQGMPIGSGDGQLCETPCPPKRCGCLEAKGISLTTADGVGQALGWVVYGHP